MERRGVDIRGDDIGLDLVAVDFCLCLSVVNGIEEREQPGGLIAIAERPLHIPLVDDGATHILKVRLGVTATSSHQYDR